MGFILWYRHSHGLAEDAGNSEGARKGWMKRQRALHNASSKFLSSLEFGIEGEKLNVSQWDEEGKGLNELKDIVFGNGGRGFNPSDARKVVGRLNKAGYEPFAYKDSKGEAEMGLRRIKHPEDIDDADVLDDGNDKFHNPKKDAFAECMTPEWDEKFPHQVDPDMPFDEIRGRDDFIAGQMLGDRELLGKYRSMMGNKGIKDYKSAREILQRLKEPMFGVKHYGIKRKFFDARVDAVRKEFEKRFYEKYPGGVEGKGDSSRRGSHDYGF